MLTPPSRTTVTTVERHARADVGPGAGQARGEDDPGQRGDEPGQDEQAELDPGDPDAREAGRAGWFLPIA